MTETPETPTELDRAWDDERLAAFTMQSRPKVPAIQLMVSYRALRSALAEKQARIEELERAIPFVEAAADEALTGPEWADKAKALLAALKEKPACPKCGGSFDEYKTGTRACVRCGHVWDAALKEKP